MKSPGVIRTTGSKATAARACAADISRLAFGEDPLRWQSGHYNLHHHFPLCPALFKVRKCPLCLCKGKYPVDHWGTNAAGRRLVGLQTWRKGDEIVCQADYSLVEASYDILALYSLPRQAFHLPFRRVAGVNPMLGNFVATTCQYQRDGTTITVSPSLPLGPVSPWAPVLPDAPVAPVAPLAPS